MPDKTFLALVVTENADHTYQRAIAERRISALPPGEVLVAVSYSSLNYKDALSATGNRGVTNHYPHTPGIDAVGVVAESSAPAFRPGDPVLVGGYDLGMGTAGGFGQYIRVPAAWVLPQPAGLSARECAIYGTAGLTAALAVDKLLVHGLRPEAGPVLVTGATGGVGSIAVALLAKLHFRVVALTGKASAADFLQQLGAAEVLPRADFVPEREKALLKGCWAGVVDTVGGAILATALKSTLYGGLVSCCGNVASPELPLNVYPFILRGVSLLGVDAAACPLARRQLIWQRLASAWRLEYIDGLATEVSLAGVVPAIDSMLRGESRGRVIVDLRRELG